MKGAVVFESIATDGTGVLQTLSTISKRVIRTLRDSGASEAGAPMAPAASAPQTARAAEPTREIALGSPASRMERAILEEAEHPEHAAIGAAAHETETLLDGPAWEQAEDGSADHEARGSLGRLRIESVGRASATGDGAVRVELVLADEEGRRSAAVLTFRIDPLEEDHRG